MSGELLNLDITVDAQGSGAYLVQLRGPAGEAHAESAAPFHAATIDDTLAQLDRAVAGERGALAMTQHFGETLFKLLFPGELLELYRASLAVARVGGARLRLRLRLHAPELARLPWEFLYDSAEDEFVALSAHTPLVRYLEVPNPMAAVQITLPLRILCVIALPSDLSALDSKAERARIEQAVSQLVSRGLVSLQWIERGTFQALQTALLHGEFHVLHFVGHGGFDEAEGEGLLAFERDAPVDGPRGVAHYVTASDIVQLLSARPKLRLVLLNACEGARGNATDVFSSTAANFVRRGIPLVVAMQYPISDRAALEFAHSFYGALMAGRAADVAVSEARTAIRGVLTGSLEWVTPLTITRSDSGVLFEFSKPRARVLARPLLSGAAVVGLVLLALKIWLPTRTGTADGILDEDPTTVSVDTSVLNLLASLDDSGDTPSKRVSRIDILDVTLDQHPSAIAVARKYLIDFVSRQTRWQDTASRCSNSSVRRPDVAAALMLAVKRAPAVKSSDTSPVALSALLHLDSTNLAGAVFSDSAILRGISFVDACLVGARMRGAKLDYSLLDGAIMDSIDLTRASLRSASMTLVAGHGAIFNKARLEGANLNGAKLHSAVFTDARLACATFAGAQLDRSNFERATAPWAYFDETSLVAVQDWAYIPLRGLRSAFIETAKLDSTRRRWAIERGADTLHQDAVDWTLKKQTQWLPDSLCFRSLRAP